MTHQPPVPQANQSPYPLQQPAFDDTPPPAVIPSAGTGAIDAPSPFLAQLLGIGAAFVGSAALAAWYYRRDKAPARKRSSADAKRVARQQPYEVAYFARKHGISADAARDIIAAAGPSRAKANALAGERRG